MVATAALHMLVMLASAAALRAPQHQTNESPGSLAQSLTESLAASHKASLTESQESASSPLESLTESDAETQESSLPISESTVSVTEISTTTAAENSNTETHGKYTREYSFFVSMRFSTDDYD